MFGFVQWDSPLAFIIEVALSLAIVVGLLFLVRRVNARAEAERRPQNAADTTGGLESSANNGNDQ